MREILFKGKRIDNGEWVSGVPFTVEDEGTFIIDNCRTLDFTNDGTDFQGCKVIPETIGQFTGLLDKNGNKIFENDIVKVYVKPYESKDPIIVVWGKKSHGWSLKFNCGDHYEHKTLIKYYSLPSSKNIEIIGNIHE